MDYHKSNNYISIPHKKFRDFLFFSKILLSLSELSEVNGINSGVSDKIFLPPA